MQGNVSHSPSLLYNLGDTEGDQNFQYICTFPANQRRPPHHQITVKAEAKRTYSYINIESFSAVPYIISPLIRISVCKERLSHNLRYPNQILN
jgi:hypothetical protein